MHHLARTKIAAATALALGGLITAHSASAGVYRLTFADNTTPNPAPPVFGTVGAFDPSTEFRVLTPSTDPAATTNLDVISGGETWTFSSVGSNIVSSVMISVGGTPGNPGVNPAFGQAPITAGVAGYPACQAASDPNCPALTQNVSVLGIPFGFLAPTALSTVANSPYTAGGSPTPFGPAHIVSFNPSVANGFQIFFPVLIAQFGSGSLLLGSDPNPAANGDKLDALSAPPPGVLFSGHVDANGDFRIYADRAFSRDEVAFAAFTRGIAQFELVGNAQVIPLPAAGWLLGAGLAGLAGVARRRKGSIV